MKAIFYDLETSDRNPVGQILNFAFLFVDEKFNLIDECCGRIRLTRLQLPSPGAILANKIDVLRHNEVAEYSEKEGLAVIWKYLAERGAQHREGINFIGYNSSRFDLTFLRTSMYRNGLSPYFQNFSYGDLLHLSKKLYMTADGFPAPTIEEGGKKRVSLSLQALGHTFGLLQGAQAHESRADVVLTIELARLYAERFGAHICSYQAYEALPHQRPGQVIRALVPNYEVDAASRSNEIRYLFHQADHRYALWLNLERAGVGEGRRALSWYKCKGDLLAISGTGELTTTEQQQVQKHAPELSRISVNNFFSASSCDIEQDIYRIDAQKLELLRRAIWDRDQRPLRSANHPDLSALYERHALANYSWGGPKDELVRDRLSQYALYRYGGRMLMAKGSEVQPYEEGVYLKDYHETFTELRDQIDVLCAEAGEADRALLQSLATYYDKSDIMMVAGAQLSEIRRKKLQLPEQASAA